MRFSSVGVLGVTLAFVLACSGGEGGTEPAVIPPGAAEVAEVPLAVPVGGQPQAKCADAREPAQIWQGEYPAPIVDVQSPLTTEVQTDLCGEAPKRQCTIAAALYHPWAFETKAEYWTVRGIDRFIADKDFPLDDGKTVPPGTVIEVTAYVGEGFCSLRVNGSETGGTCPDVLTDDAGNSLAHRDGPESSGEQQFVAVDCTDGGKGYWLVNDAIFQLPGVKQGELVEYGKVKGAGAEPLPPG